MSLAVTTEARRANEPRRARRHNINARERAHIITLLRNKPIAVVVEQSGRSMSTLMRIADMAHRNGEL